VKPSDLGSMLSRVVARIALAVAFAAALSTPLVALWYRGPDEPETWIVTTAALAVAASVIAAWSSRRVLELQEDAQKPKPYPVFDLASRHQLALLRVKNTGGTAAHDVRLEWDIDLANHEGERIGFWADGITVLLPGESVSQVIDVHHQFMKAHADAVYTGTIRYKDASGARYSEPFLLDARPYARSPTYGEEDSRTHYELQKIPEELRKLRSAIEKATG
jgi:hypothetical protein